MAFSFNFISFIISALSYFWTEWLQYPLPYIWFSIYCLKMPLSYFLNIVIFFVVNLVWGGTVLNEILPVRFTPLLHLYNLCHLFVSFCISVFTYICIIFFLCPRLTLYSRVQTENVQNIWHGGRRARLCSFSMCVDSLLIGSFLHFFKFFMCSAVNTFHLNICHLR